MGSPKVYIYTWTWIPFKGNPGLDFFQKEARARCRCILLGCLARRSQTLGLLASLASLASQTVWEARRSQEDPAMHILATSGLFAFPWGRPQDKVVLVVLKAFQTTDQAV